MLAYSKTCYYLPLKLKKNLSSAIAEGKTIKMELVEWRIDLDALFAVSLRYLTSMAKDNLYEAVFHFKVLVKFLTVKNRNKESTFFFSGKL